MAIDTLFQSFLYVNFYVFLDFLSSIICLYVYVIFFLQKTELWYIILLFTLI